MTVPVTLAHPLALLLLPLAVLVVTLGRRRLGPRWRAATALRAATVGLLVLALSGPLVQIPASEVSVVFAVDRSLSMMPDGQRAAVAFLQAAQARMGSHDRAGVVTFAGRALLRVPVEPHPAMEDLGPPPDADATDIGAALDLAVRVLPPDGARRIVVLSDGAETRGDAAVAARTAAAQGVEVDAVPIFPRTPADALVDAVEAPQEVHVGETYEVRALLRATVPAQATVTLSRNGAVMATRHLSLPAGEVATTFADVARDTGAVRYRVDLAASPDEIPENDHGEAIVVVRGQPRVLFVTGHRTPLPHWLARQGLRLDIRGPDELPVEATGFAAYGSVVLDDVPAPDLSRSQQDTLRAYVGAGGGGLVAIGGPHSYGVGGYAGTPLEAVLPVTMDVRQTLTLPTVAIVLVIDTSGSMEAFGTELAKEELAKEIASSVIDLLGEHDQIGVITFDQDYRWLVPPTGARHRAQVLQQVARIQAGGGTVMYPPLRAAWQFLRTSPAKVRHVIVLSDGLTDPADFRALVTAMARSGVTVSSVAIGRDADIEFMRNLARWGGGRQYAAKDLYSVPKILTAEALMAARAFIIEEPVGVTRTGPAPTLAGLSAPPPFRGYVATVAKPAAQVALMSPRGDPILATWQYGLGRTAAFTSDDGVRWTAPWASWRDVARFWSQAIRWTLRGEGGALQLTAQIDATGAQARAVLDARRADGAPWDGLSVLGDVASPGGERRSIALDQAGPGRYEASWPAMHPGVYTLTAAARDARGTQGVSTVGLVVPYSPEYRVPGGNLGLLGRLTEISGGAVLQKPEEAFRPGRGTGARETWPALGSLALGMLVAEVTLRRLPALGRHLAAAGAAVVGWARRDPGTGRDAQAASDRAYAAADRWAVEEARFAEDAALRAASMEHAARLFIARLRQTKRP